MAEHYAITKPLKQGLSVKHPILSGKILPLPVERKRDKIWP